MAQISMFDFADEKDRNTFNAIKSDDWKRQKKLAIN